ncbi:Septin-type G domain-containing protein [Meloidogyne graminicola]|uniref:Septin n=1 Tax=Meloidogyne graminicola TaxID=189291 RepID=A0A8S9ZRG3_9BILA|nr:Septin-type G domain-containing protein [Meloidogyne graminicola]
MTTITDISRVKNNGGISSRNIDYVGFANFPNQVFRRCIKNGFEFSLMVVGQSGLGKSTFLNTLFMAELHDLKNNNIIEQKSTVKIESKTFRLVENDVRLKITVVDTPGFGDFVDNSKCWEPIVKYIDDRFADYLEEETKIDRSSKIEDKRIHLCIYFIPPTGHGLKQLDIAFMQALQDRVNIIPLIAKADTLTQSELCRFKQRIMDEMKANNISFYKFPELIINCEQLPNSIVNGGTITNGVKFQQQQHQNTVENNNSISIEKRLPFAVVGSTHIKEVLVGGEQRATKQRVRIREYPWGTVEVDNLAHNDFMALRDMIIKNNLIDLIEVTKCVHYENYRKRNLPQNTFDDDPFTQLEKETIARQIEADDTRQKREALFNEGVADREQRLAKKALSMDTEEKENQKVLEEKRALLDKLRQEIASTKKGANLSASSLDSGSTNTIITNSSSRTSPPTDKITTKKRIGHLFGARNC